MIGIVFVFYGLQKLFGWFGGHGIKGTGGWFESIGIKPGILIGKSGGIFGLGCRYSIHPWYFPTTWSSANYNYYDWLYCKSPR